MISLLLDPLILLLFMWLLARHEADFSYLKLLLITLCIALIANGLGMLNPWLGLISYIILIPLALHRFCYITLKSAVLITALFIVWQVAWHLITDSISLD